MISPAKLNVLCLHGKEQNAELFRSRLGRIPVKAKAYARFHIVDAPYELPLKDGDQVCMRSWYHRDASGQYDLPSIDHSIRYLHEIWEGDSGPFHGILGFSQGGTMAAIMASQQQLFKGLQFIICYGAPDVKHDRYASIPSAIRSLHFAGKSDAVVAMESSKSLFSRFSDGLFIEHEQGHCIPMKADYIATTVDFIIANLQSVSSQSSR